MTPADVRRALGAVPMMTLEQGEKLTALLREYGLRDVLELGFAHGVSTCYLAAAVQEHGGHVTTVDLQDARRRKPNLDELLGRIGLASYVTAYYEPTSYTWRLMRMLEEDPAPRFDLCFIDGAHTWAVDGFAFFLVDRLLRPGGWLVFDDLDWKVEECPTTGPAARAAGMPEDERTTAQVDCVYELLVKPHPSYGEFRREDKWAFARKHPDAASVASAPRREVVVETRLPRLRDLVPAPARRVARRLLRRT